MAHRMMLDECAGLVLVAARETGKVSCVGCGSLLVVVVLVISS